MSTESVKLGVEESEDDIVVHSTAFRVLESFDEAADEEKQEDIRIQTRRALKAYPELAGKTVTIGRLDPDEDARGQAWFYNFLTCYPVDCFVSWQTVYHELAHLAIHVRDQRGENVPPTSEEYCAIVAVSRMPVKRLEHDNREDVSYLGEPGVPKDEWPDICQRALEYREENGANSHYIQRAKEWLEI